MANGLADTKVALGFAGVVIAIAVVGAMSMDYIIPAIQDGAAEEQVVEAAPETVPSPKPQPTPVATTWADEGMADDWGAAPATSPSNGGNEAGGSAVEESFAGFAPSTNGAQESGSQRPGTRRVQSGSRSGAGQVRSSAASGAPAVSAPGGVDADGDVRIEG